MTKPVLCRILESKPLDRAEGFSQEDSYDPYPAAVPHAAGRPIAGLGAWQKQREFYPDRYSIRNRMNQAAPKGIWIDLWA